MANTGYHHENLKAELIEKGLALLDQEGYEGFSLRKVANACNVSQTAPYRHFRNKDDLILAILGEAMRTFDQNLREAVQGVPGDPIRQLKEMGFAYIRFFTENPAYLHLLFSSDLFSRLNRDAPHAATDDARTDNGAHPFDTFHQAVRRYAEASTANTLAPDDLALYCWGLVHGISVLISHRDKLPFSGDFLAMARHIMDDGNFLP